ncbi:hypothetical protein PRIPAC_86105 [Pristionchus pacificus]|uniref:Lon N-terminal domain-containing protein n=1 Tax=Pristionchus pacificus TaxID=54126 RepID=A0A2A6BKD7_PRIPA|nr:hypothetical protein PRIPAC_86105 [Pristionchus pacificus]|eukprot:PDM66369.1 hypothetical protein PRIPAC_47786 [Pristionchus pacificus]
MLRASVGLISRSFRVQRAFCSSGDAMKPEQELTDQELIDEITHDTDFKEVGGSLSTVTVPDAYPDVPIIPIVRYPFFPTFIKRVDITKDESLKEALRRQMDLRQPYAGVSKSPVVSSLSELYNVGSFVSITEFRDLGSVIEEYGNGSEICEYIEAAFYPEFRPRIGVIEMVLLAHRRIRILEPLAKTGRGPGRKGRGVGIDKPQSAGIREAAAAARENGSRNSSKDRADLETLGVGETAM